jgi:hypothetical protein
MCDNLELEIAALAEKKVMCSAVHEERWGSVTKIRLRGGGEIGLYQPKHPTSLGLGQNKSASQKNCQVLE